MSEKIEDIVREMRRKADQADFVCCGNVDASFVRVFADCIEKAYEQEKCKWAASITKQRAINKELVDDMAAKDEEIKKLRAARDLWFGRADELRVRCDELYAELKKEAAK